ncbi:MULTISPECIES: ATP-binding protein [unclassified Sedimentibacter]|uniref:ATP-binding protein n=1 Tax=unclassified Sedimentibacter TaxID=2649220 RepID=UPI0027E0DF5F|nr:transporter substrate-binding domain-containing protein [Sedimentibacter sp. MB35-C1]WMJ78805.1 transporter substrate-binding domain-containing protein [Sedimentibacter sp. MB35-C1]
MTKINKKIVYSIMAFTVLVILIAVNQIIINNYDLSVYEYIEYSLPLTEREVNFLSEKETLYFSSDKNAPPFAYIDNNSGQYKGLVLDYVNALSIELEADIEFLPKTWGDVAPSVIEGSSDMCDIFPSDERKKNFIFSEPIYRLRAVVMTGDSSNISVPADLSGCRVAVPSGDYAVEYIRNNIPGVEVVEVADLLESIKLFDKGSVDAVVGDEPVLLYFLNQLDMKDSINILDTVLYDSQVSIGVNKSNPLLAKIINKGILSLKKKNYVQKIQQKWFGISAPIMEHRVPARLMLILTAVISGLILIFSVMLLWSYTLKLQVIKRTEELNKSRNNLQMTVDALSSFLICVDSEDRITSANKSFCEYVNISSSSMHGQYYKNIPLLSNIGIKTSSVKNNEFSFLGKYYLYSLLEMNYKECSYLIVIEDITDQKISQQQVLQQNKMIALGQLAAGVAHEIRNPLGLIQNYCYILKTYVMTSNPVAKDSIEVIESSVERMDGIVNNLLNFSRSGNGKLSCIDIKKFINDITSMENKFRLKSNITVSINCSKDIKFLTIEESMKHIFLNLFSNAADAMPDGGKIIIDCVMEEDYLYVDFSDAGCGISDESIERIFNPFFTTKSSGHGTGLGLYIVYNEVQKLGGEIRVESHMGKGTVFKMKFPVVKEMRENV